MEIQKLVQIHKFIDRGWYGYKYIWLACCYVYSCRIKLFIPVVSSTNRGLFAIGRTTHPKDVQLPHRLVRPDWATPRADSWIICVSHGYLKQHKHTPYTVHGTRWVGRAPPEATLARRQPIRVLLWNRSMAIYPACCHWVSAVHGPSSTPPVCQGEHTRQQYQCLLVKSIIVKYRCH